MHRQVYEFIHAAHIATGLDVDVIVGERGTRSCSDTRMAVFYLARTMTSASYPEIGSIFNRHHATIMHGFRTFSARLESGDPHALELLQRIRKEVAMVQA